MKLQRILSLLIILIPGGLAIYGWTLMRDAVYDYFAQAGFPWMLFLLGLLCFLSGISFLGGFIYYRDKKRRYGKRFVDDLDD